MSASSAENMELAISNTFTDIVPAKAATHLRHIAKCTGQDSGIAGDWRKPDKTAPKLALLMRGF